MLLQHVNDVLDMSRLEAGAAENIKCPFDPVAVTTELLDSLKMAANDRGNSLELEVLDPSFALVVGDPAKLRQILTNLVGNAIKFTRDGTILVEIEPHMSEGQWELRVTDNGIGISEENQDRIFEDFVTLDPSYTRAQEGSGLGLAIVRRLVEHLGGEVGVESDIGSGSVFWVKLPTNVMTQGRHDVVAATTQDRELVSETSTELLSVLLVEDNAINRVVAREMLEKLGHTAVEAHNGKEGVELANRDKFDAILMDISMPEMDGVEATKRIIEGSGPNANTPIHAVTAHAMPADIDRFAAAGMSDVLIKPIGLNRLKALLAEKRTAIPQINEMALWDASIQQELRQSVGPAKHDLLLEQFVQEMDDAMTSSFAIDSISEPETLRAEVHRVAGSAAILGASELRSRLHEIERHLVENDLDHVLSKLRDLDLCWARTRDDMR